MSETIILKLFRTLRIFYKILSNTIQVKLSVENMLRTYAKCLVYSDIGLEIHFINAISNILMTDTEYTEFYDHHRRVYIIYCAITAIIQENNV